MNSTKNKIRKYAEHFLKVEMMKHRLDVFQNESSFNGVDYIIRSKNGSYNELFLQPINLESERSIHINQEQHNFQLLENRFVALVVFMKDIEPFIYLFPFNVFEHPNHIFLCHDQGEMFEHLSTWEIKIFTRGIPELEKFALKKMISFLE